MQRHTKNAAILFALAVAAAVLITQALVHFLNSDQPTEADAERYRQCTQVLEDARQQTNDLEALEAAIEYVERTCPEAQG